MNANNIAKKNNQIQNDLMQDNCKIFEHAAQLPNGGLFFKHDPEVNLFAIIAIHSTALGPALGGCRLLSYPNINSAAVDAIRLARGMSYKAAITGISTGGGKAVLIKPNKIENPEKYFKSFAKFVNTLGGKYITAMDSGTSLKEMDIIAKYTPYVASLTTDDELSHGDPSPFTAVGVFEGIKAAVKFQLNKDSLKDLTIAMQGVGHVGKPLAQELYKAGAKLIVADIDSDATDYCKQKFNAQVVSSQDIHKAKCDIFAPCALGSSINDVTIDELNTKIIAGSANNQLQHHSHGEILHKKGILYATDYVINSGGLIFAESLYLNNNKEKVFNKIKNINTSLINIFEQSHKLNLPTNIIANQIAEAKLRENGDNI
tara:strand:- start:6461 stop:7579 length:1119 start_codon:yes stop_codon:yes gene_type:complete